MPQMWKEVSEMTQPISAERILEHGVVVCIFRVDGPLIQIQIVEEGGIIPRETVQHRADEQVPEWPVP